MRPIVTDRVAWFVRLSVTIVSPAKTAEPIEMPFGAWTRVGPWNHALDGVHIGATRQIRLKGKERKSIYVAPFCTKVHTKRSGIDHTVLPANNTMPAFPSWRSPDVTTTATEAADIQLQLTTHLSTPKG